MYRSLEECLLDLEKHKQLIRVREEVDPNLEMAAIHMRVHALKGPALLFEKVKGSPYRAASNLFGTLERSEWLFRDTWSNMQKLISLRNDPLSVLKKPFQNIGTGISAIKALPLKRGFKGFKEIKISDLPHIKHWPQDGGAFVTLPQVYTEDYDKPGILHANLGMYRIQLSGNEYEPNREVGLHYQIHRGIGIHQAKCNAAGAPLKVSIFIGGPPAHALAAVMPLPEGLSELTFAGMLGARRFHYHYENGFCISNDADFVITGEVFPGDNKPEGPFGDHLGYYSLKHPFPLMKVNKVYAKPAGIWNFTVVGRPPQEDTAFGALIHELTGDAIQQDIPGIKEVHAVDAAGVHPLLFAIGSERYTPYLPTQQPAEILTQANRILGTGQLSLAKFLWITADDKNLVSTQDEQAFINYMLERIEWSRDLHFQTNTTIDTLDYSGTALNSGSKVILAAYGPKKRDLCREVILPFKELQYFENPHLVSPGVIALHAGKFENYEQARMEMHALSDMLMFQAGLESLTEAPLIIICDDPRFMAATWNNFLWTTFTRCNPAYDMYGVDSFVEHKHWGCRGPLILDARIKPHHAPLLIPDADIEKKIDRLFEKGGSLQQIH
jgi:4-hydroxy-3-polyprenylbenzoate decarboxylase